MSGYRTQSEDTDPRAERVLIEGYRRMSPWEKARCVSELAKACEELARIGILIRHPDATEREIRLRLASLSLDRDTMVRVFGWDPVEKGY